MKKNIAIFVHCFPPAKGGAEYLSGKLAEVFGEKYNVDVFTGQGETLDSYKNFEHYIYDDIPRVHRLKVNVFLQKLANKFFNKIIFKIGFFSPFYFGPILNYTPNEIEIIKKSDVIVGIAMPTKSFYDAYKFANKFNKKLILVPTYHNVNYYNRCIFFQKAFDYAQKVCYLTPFEKKELQKNYNIIDSKFVQTTLCPFTLEEIEEQDKKNSKTILQKEAHIKNKKITLGFIGQITQRKNLTLFKYYLDKYISYWKDKDFVLNILLSGAKTNSSQKIEEIFQNYISNKTVTISYDFKDHEKEFEKIDIFVSPSEEESLGIVNFEAMYFGVPVFLNSAAAFSSLVNGSDMLFTDIDQLHKKILLLISSPTNYQIKVKQQMQILNNNNNSIFREAILNKL